MPLPSDSWLGLDVGGANIKAAHSSGPARSLPFELWKRPDELARVLTALAGTLPPAGRVALTMTAELCDCYPTKAHGVIAVLDAVEEVFRDRPVAVWGTDERFHRPAAIRLRPELAAAANWLALAVLAARLLPRGPGVLIDIGTTTTDLIPLRDGRPAPRGRTDTQRLQTGELIYAGIRRTPVCALATELPFRGVPTGLAAELFATTLDVYLTLGDLPPDPADLATADGRPATVTAARDRLARMVGADRGGFSAADAAQLARAADQALMDRLARAAERACRASVGMPRGAIVAGAGAVLAHRLAERLLQPGEPIISLHQVWGPVASTAGCAHALVALALEQVEAREALAS
jgi:probable H4MPT-linked C1 transfer pathway protein